MMAKFTIICHARATIREEWLLEADTADEARRLFEEDSSQADFVEDETIGDEENREVLAGEIGVYPAAATVMEQYRALKAEVPDCLLLFRMGDFFELFFDDAKTAASCLDIALTARGEHDGARVPMCGVPIHAADAYLARLIRAGHRVAIADLVESPAQAKGRGGAKALAARAIVRVVTAGNLAE